MAARLDPSDFHVDVVTVILSYLPTIQAVRTSILSRFWRDQWRSFPALAFDLKDDLDIAAVDHVLRRHSVPIHSFSLSIGCELHCRDLNRWFAALSPNPVPIRPCDRWIYPDPDRWLSPLTWDPHTSSNLKHLRLHGGLPTNNFDHFLLPVLETLRLSGRVLSDSDGSLIIDCPFLQKLTLPGIECSSLQICAPKLHSLTFRGTLGKFQLSDDAPLLTTVVFHHNHYFGDYEDEEMDESNTCNLVLAFGQARNIEKLSLLGYSFNFLGWPGVPGRVPDTFERLKILTSTLHFSIRKEILLLLCLLRSAPNLREIKIEGLERNQEIWGLGDEFWLAEDYLELPKLQTLELTHTRCVEPMMGFIDYILPKAPELVKLEINISPGSNKYGDIAELSNSEELERQWRASTRAQIIFTGTKCSAELTMKTDPQNSDYVVESGAACNFEPWRAEEEASESLKRKRDAEEMGDAVRSLENTALDSKKEMDIRAALEEMKSTKSRHATVSVDDMLASLKRSAYEKGSKDYVRRLQDDEDDDEWQHPSSSLKERSTSGLPRVVGSPTDALTKASVPKLNFTVKPKPRRVADDDKKPKEETTSGLDLLRGNYGSGSGSD